ncbi:MAG: hypothetical protein MPJ04_08680, partial [Nitrosopumilus sp.]|nr:hypothetical protein [Nitrosopumilus sp.]
MQGIARRSASITLMAIMVAGGMTIAFPEAVPEAAAAEPRKLANLGISSTIFGGPMVLEIIVQDPNIDDTGIQQGAPDVTFDGKDLIMIQGDDGYWYAYVANVDMIRHVEAFMESDRGESLAGSSPDFRNGYVNAPGTGMDFGRECIGDQADAIITGKDFSADAVFVANVTCGSESGQTTDVSVRANNVMRSAKTPSTPGGVGSDPGDNIGNNGMTSLAYWPFIQAFDDISDDSRIKVTYNKGGSPQEITIKYESDMDDLASLTLDRENYPHESFVHMTLEESLFNIDPTDEDVWSWHGDNGDVYYYIFNSDRTVSLGDTETDGLNLSADLLSRIDFGTSGPIRFDRNPLTNLDGNPEVLMLTPRDEAVEDGQMPTGNGDRFVGRDFGDGGPFVTVKETGANTGIFTNTDGRSTSDLMTNDADSIGREVPFGFTYADTAQNWFVGFTTGSVNMDEASVGSDWSSGERMTISVTDQDHNRNSLVKEHLVIPADNADLLRIRGGDDPTTITAAHPVYFQGPGSNRVLGDDGTITFDESAGDFERFSPLSLHVEVGGAQQSASILNDGESHDVGLYGIFDLSDFGDNAEYRLRGDDMNKWYTEWIPANDNMVRLDSPSVRTSDTGFTGNLHIAFRNTDNLGATRATIQMIIWQFDVSDTLYSVEPHLDPFSHVDGGATLEETGLNTGIFAGTIEYTMLNQINTEFGGAP